MESKDSQKETRVGEEKEPAAGKKAAPPTGEKMAQVREAEYQELLRSAADYKDKYIRLYAEFENTRKRLERDKQEFVKYANEGLIIEFLDILDDLQRSVDAAGARHQDYDSFLKGVEMIMAHVYDMLKRNGLKPIEAMGKKFDPHCHEVLMQFETDEYEEGTVVEEFQKGYYLGDRVIRTAKVKVAVKPRAKESPQGQAAGPETTADESGRPGGEGK